MTKPRNKEPKSKADLSKIPCMILCGGLGTRMGEATERIPKPMLEIGGQPILLHIMRIYAHYGVRRFILCLGYRGDVIQEYFFNFLRRQRDYQVDLSSGRITPLLREPAEPWQVFLANTGANSYTGARVISALRYVREKELFVTYGDGVANIDLRALYKLHRETGRDATVTAVHPSSRFGELSVDGSTVTSFNEKPQTANGWINGGFLVFKREALVGYDTTNTQLSLEKHIVEDLASKRRLSVYQHDGFWQCMDTQREAQLLGDMWQKGEAPWKIWK